MVSDLNLWRTAVGFFMIMTEKNRGRVAQIGTYAL